jgi:adenosylmethionine-8-amino-7-oxononanoate aminotransferase
MTPDTRRWIAQDQAHLWHPFTPQDEWCAPGHEPLVLVRGEGAWLWDSEGRRYLDGNSSIWTNIHGHGHPRIIAAIERQLHQVAHTSFLGCANPRASELAERLCAFWPAGTLERVFFSDDGSTAIECALKMAIQFRQQTGEPHRTGFIAFTDAYHGDTMGAASLGGVPRFFDRFRQCGMPVVFVRDLAALRELPPQTIAATAAVAIEPLIQGVNGMRPWPAGMLHDLRDWCDRHRVHLIADEVLTGFGRTGTMFACHQEHVAPDFLCLAKGLSGGLLPLAATLTTNEVYQAFLGGPDRTFYYGHSYTANQLGCAAALASLEVFEEDHVLERVPDLAARLRRQLAALQAACPNIREIRQCGLIAGIDLNPDPGAPQPPHSTTGAHACRTARHHGLLTRPIGDTIVLMPPLCIIEQELDLAVEAIFHAVRDQIVPHDQPPRR